MSPSSSSSPEAAHTHSIARTATTRHSHRLASAGAGAGASPASVGEGATDNFEDIDFYIFDARSSIAAMANRALGKGTENIDNYAGGRLKFMGISNIHSVRSSFNKLAELARPGSVSEDDDNFERALANCGWLQHVKSVLRASIKIVSMLENEGKSVLTHCSDGWDRTSQMTSLAMLLLDPHYRTRRGFALLVEKEWCSFGHKFLDSAATSTQSTTIKKDLPFFFYLLTAFTR